MNRQPSQTMLPAQRGGGLFFHSKRHGISENIETALSVPISRITGVILAAKQAYLFPKTTKPISNSLKPMNLYKDITLLIKVPFQLPKSQPFLLFIHLYYLPTSSTCWFCRCELGTSTESIPNNLSTTAILNTFTVCHVRCIRGPASLDQTISGKPFVAVSCPLARGGGLISFLLCYPGLISHDIHCANWKSVHRVEPQDKAQLRHSRGIDGPVHHINCSAHSSLGP